MKKLRSLSFCGNPKCKREDINEMLRLCTIHCCDLNSLCINYDSHYLSALFTLLQKFKKLRYLFIPNIDFDIIDNLKPLNAIKSLEILHLQGSKFNPITIQNINESLFSRLSKDDNLL